MESQRVYSVVRKPSRFPVTKTPCHLSSDCYLLAVFVVPPRCPRFDLFASGSSVCLKYFFSVVLLAYCAMNVLFEVHYLDSSEKEGCFYYFLCLRCI